MKKTDEAHKEEEEISNVLKEAATRKIETKEVETKEVKIQRLKVEVFDGEEKMRILTAQFKILREQTDGKIMKVRKLERNKRGD